MTAFASLTACAVTTATAHDAPDGDTDAKHVGDPQSPERRQACSRFDDRAEWLACVNHSHAPPPTVWVFYLNEDGNPVIEETDSPPEGSVLLDVTLDQDGNFEAASAQSASNNAWRPPPSVSAGGPPPNDWSTFLGQLKRTLDRTTQTG